MLNLKSKVGPKGQVVIPKPIRDQYKVYPGQDVYFSLKGDTVIMTKKSGREILNELFAAVKDKEKPPKKIDWDKEYYSQFED